MLRGRSLSYRDRHGHRSRPAGQVTAADVLLGGCRRRLPACALAAGSMFFEVSGASRRWCRASAEAEGCEKVWGLAGVVRAGASAPFRNPRVLTVVSDPDGENK
jgi:hypothetical protein